MSPRTCLLHHKREPQINKPNQNGLEVRLDKPPKTTIKEASKNKLQRKRGRATPNFGLKTGDRSTGH